MCLHEVLLTIKSRSTHECKCWRDLEVDMTSTAGTCRIDKPPSALTDTQRHSLTKRFRQRALNPHLNLLLPSHRFLAFHSASLEFQFHLLLPRYIFYRGVGLQKNLFIVRAEVRPEIGSMELLARETPGCVRLNFGSRSFRCCWCWKRFARLRQNDTFNDSAIDCPKRRTEASVLSKHIARHLITFV